MRGIRFLPLVSAALILAGCNPVADDNTSAVVLTATVSGPEGEVGAIGLLSDVVTDAGVTEDDFIEVNINSIPKAQTPPGSFYTVQFEGVQIAYTRPDGKNQPGVDVPFPVTYAIGGSVAPGGTTQLTLLVVTKEMKLQPPLRNLWFSTNQRINTTLHIRVFGHDLVENEVAAEASAVVIFGDTSG